MEQLTSAMGRPVSGQNLGARDGAGGTGGVSFARGRRGARLNHVGDGVREDGKVW